MPPQPTNQELTTLTIGIIYLEAEFALKNSEAAQIKDCPRGQYTRWTGRLTTASRQTQRGTMDEQQRHCTLLQRQRRLGNVHQEPMI